MNAWWRHWRTGLLWAGLGAVLVVANAGIIGRERLLREGEVLLLELAPADPRSMLQGDYMALRFAIGDDIERALGADGRMPGGRAHRTMASVAASHDGYAILRRDAGGIGRFVREQSKVTPRTPGEIALRYRGRDGEIRVVTNAWFFPEGSAPRYADARYGELRVGSGGEALLTGMRDAARSPL